MESLFALMGLVAELKLVGRDGWNNLGRTVNDAESVGDHSYGISMMAIGVRHLAPHLSVDWHKVLLLCLVHDLVEAKTGDINLFTATNLEERKLLKEHKKRLEHSAILQIQQEVGGTLGDEVFTLWMEYEDNQTGEAHLGHELDKIEAALQAYWYYRRGHSLNPREFYDSCRAAVTTPELVKFLEEELLPKLP